MVLKDQMRDWLTGDRLHDPEVKLSFTATNHIKTIANQVPANQTSANALITGKAIEKAKEQGKTIQKLVSENNSDYYNVLGDSPSNGLTTIINIASAKAGWSPINPNQDEASHKFLQYTNILAKNPFLHVKASKAYSMKYQKSDYDSLIDSVSSLIKSAIKNDTNDILDSVKEIAKTALTNMNNKETTTLFNQNVITVDSDAIVELYMYYSTVSFEVEHHSGKHAPSDKYKSEINISSAVYSFQAANWTAEVAKLFKKEQISVLEQWIKNNKTEENKNKTVNFCFNTKLKAVG